MHEGIYKMWAYLSSQFGLFQECPHPKALPYMEHQNDHASSQT
jgi:hypothetical protein